MEDGTKWYKTKIYQNYLRTKVVKIMNYPLQSPDLNPIENIWIKLKELISRHKYKARGRADFTEVMREEWSQISKDFLLKLYNSIPGRYRACPKNKGSATKY